MMPRDGAGKIDLVGGTGLLAIADRSANFQWSFSKLTTFQGQSPIPSIQAGQSLMCSDVAKYPLSLSATLNEIVARVFIQCAEALNNKTLKRGDENKIKVALHTCKEDIAA